MSLKVKHSLLHFFFLSHRHNYWSVLNIPRLCTPWENDFSDQLSLKFPKWGKEKKKKNVKEEPVLEWNYHCKSKTHTSNIQSYAHTYNSHQKCFKQ